MCILVNQPIYIIQVKTNNNKFLQKEIRPGMFVNVEWIEVDFGPPSSHWSFEHYKDINAAKIFANKQEALNAIKKYGVVGAVYDILEYNLNQLV
jgi:hypothetical protein